MSVLKVAADFGNSNTKIYIGENRQNIPSVIKRNYTQPSSTDVSTESAIENIFSNLCAFINSGALSGSCTYFVGRLAMIQEDHMNMDITHGEKAENDIPIVIGLVGIAADQVQEYYKNKNEVPQSIDLNVALTTAIPANQFSQQKAQAFADRYTKNKHTVVLYLQDINNTSITVNINFIYAKATAEGVPALWTLFTSNKNILDRYNNEYEKQAIPIDLKDLNMLHVDIGDGTVELVVTESLTPVISICEGKRHGVGHAAENAMDLYKEKLGSNVEINRQEFMKLMEKENKRGILARSFMEQTIDEQIDAIYKSVVKKYEKTSDLDLIVVYGGGSIVFEKNLYKRLLEFCNKEMIELLWIPEEYTVDMNVKGLKYLAEKADINKKNDKSTK